MRRILATAAACSAGGFLAGLGAVAAVLPPLVRHSGHYGSHAGARRS